MRRPNAAAPVRRWPGIIACALPIASNAYAQPSAADHAGGVVLKMTSALGVASAAPTPLVPGTAGESLPGLRPARALGAAVASSSPLASALPYSQLVLSVRVNSVSKGEFIGYMGGNRDFLFSPSDLKAMDIVDAEGGLVDIEGAQFVSLRSLPGVELTFNEKKLSLDIMLPAAMLPRQQKSLGAEQPRMPVQARSPGGFLNYRLAYTDAIHSNGMLNGATELGVNVGQALFLNTHNFTVGNAQNHGVRLQTQLIYDQPDALRRFVAGDVFASSGDLGSTLNLGGLSISKVYNINPYFLKQPLVGFTGSVAAPSNADVFIDGVRVSTAKLAPGSFNLQNINYINGLHNVDLVIRDPFGGEQHISFPYFFNDQLLAKGLQEYSYNLGFIRNNFGQTSFDYGRAAASMFHRYGVSDALTIGAGADITARHINIGPRVLYNTGPAGIVSAGFAVSRDSSAPAQVITDASGAVTVGPATGAASGSAVALGYTYISGPFTLQGAMRRYSQNYNLIGFIGVDKPKLQASAAMSYGTRTFGTTTLAQTVQTVYGGEADQRATTISYSRSIGSNLFLSGSVSRVSQASPVTGSGFEVTKGYTALVTLAYYPKSPTAISAGFSQQKTLNGDTSSQLQIARTTPIGEGFGYRVLVERNVNSGVPSENLAPFLQYNARNAIFTAEGNSTSSAGANHSSYQMAVAGAVVNVGGGSYLSRPVDDGYGVVKLEPAAAGVRVYRSGTQIGVTNDSGAVFVPSLGSYQINTLEIQPKDLPLDNGVASARQEVRPPLRGGAVARFAVTRVRAVTGKLMLRSGGALTPLDDYEFALRGPTPEVKVRTVRGGEFYLENLTPGIYSAALQAGAQTCTLEFEMPDSQEIIADLGEVICEIHH